MLDELETPEVPASDTTEHADDGAEVVNDAPETPSAPSGDTPKKWAGKYDSPEELERAYTNAQKHLTKVSQQFSSLKKQAAPASQEYPTGQVEEINAAILQALQTDPFGTLNLLVQEQMKNHLQPLQAASREVKIQGAVQQLMTEHPDFPEMADTVQKMLEEDSDLADLFERNPAKALNLAYRASKADAVAKALPKVVEMATQQAYKNISAKQAVTQTPAGKTETPPKKDVWGLSSAEFKALLEKVKRGEQIEL